MNRYQQQVAEMDQRHHVRMRMMTFAGAAVLVVVALWAADFRIGTFDLARAWQSARDWWHQGLATQGEGKPASMAPIPSAAPVPKDAITTKALSEKIPGTDSSVSTVPFELLLIGTKPGRNSREGLAFIGIEPLHPQTYVAGAIMENGARLTEIYADHIVLEKAGHRVSLYLHNQIGSAKKASSKDSMLFVGGPVQVVATKPTTVESPMDYIRYVPMYSDGRIVGFTVYPGMQSGAFGQWGLKAGDVIQAVDGTPPANSDEMDHLLKPIVQGAAVVATVLRQKATVSVSLDGAYIVQQKAARSAAMAASAAMSSSMPR